LISKSFDVFNVFACLQRTSDTAVLLTKNEIRAVKKLVFKVVRTTLSIQKMDTDFHSCGVDLAAVLVWAIREQRRPNIIILLILIIILVKNVFGMVYISSNLPKEKARNFLFPLHPLSNLSSMIKLHAAKCK